MCKIVIKKCLWPVAVVAIVCMGLMLICNQIVVSNAEGKAFSDIDSIKYNKVGLLLGTTPQARITKVKNYFFIYRLDAAEQLYRAGKIEKILISGDENSLDGVNEPECMRDSLVARGVPTNAIILDGKGYRTINSIINTNKVYGLKSFTIISQQFHNERAIYQAEHLGLDIENIQAYNAKMPKSRRAYLTSVREYFARVKMFIDLITYRDTSTSNTVDYQNNVRNESLTNDNIDIISLRKDSFIIKYKKPVNGYQVKAIAKLAVSDVDIVAADLVFSKNGNVFRLHTQCLCDTIFSKGRLDFKSENPTLFNHYKCTEVDAEYNEYIEGDRQMPMYTPFFFMDLDFDGTMELVIVHQSMGVKFHDGYDIYRIVEDKPFLIDYPPYNDNKEYWGFGMTDYPEFDYKKKTISCPYPEGEIKWEGRNIYGVSKTRKDTVVVNGRKHYFNHMEVIEEIKYDE